MIWCGGHDVVLRLSAAPRKEVAVRNEARVAGAGRETGRDGGRRFARRSPAWRAARPSSFSTSSRCRNTTTDKTAHAERLTVESVIARPFRRCGYGVGRPIESRVGVGAAPSIGDGCAWKGRRGSWLHSGLSLGELLDDPVGHRRNRGFVLDEVAPDFENGARCDDEAAVSAGVDQRTGAGGAASSSVPQRGAFKSARRILGGKRQRVGITPARSARIRRGQRTSRPLLGYSGRRHLCRGARDHLQSGAGRGAPAVFRAAARRS